MLLWYLDILFSKVFKFELFWYVKGKWINYRYGYITGELFHSWGQCLGVCLSEVCLLKTQKNNRQEYWLITFDNGNFNMQQKPSWNSHWPIVSLIVYLILFMCLYLWLWNTDPNYCIFFLFQIQNADDVLISPLERFRKEQIGAVKVAE